MKNAIQSKHVELPAGRVETGAQEYGIRLNGEYASVEELANLPIKNVNGAIIRIRAIARASKTVSKTSETSLSTTAKIPS